MNAPLIARRTYWHLASVAAASCLWMICTGQGPIGLAAASPTVGWRTESLQPTDSWNTFVVEMSVNRRQVNGTGEATGVGAPTASYRLERSNLAGAWRTVVTVLSVDRSSAYALSGALLPPGAFPVARVEDDEDGSPVRAYDTRGRLLKPFVSPVSLVDAAGSPTPMLRSSGREWIDSFVATTANKTRRVQDLERRFGRGVKTAGVSRYTRQDADVSEEALVQSRTAVPIEMNSARSGARTSHRTFTYGPAPDSALVRTFVHSDTLLSEGGTDRAIVDTAFSNICLERRR